MGGEGERNVGKHTKREPKPNSSDEIEERFLEMWHQVQLEGRVGLEAS